MGKKYIITESQERILTRLVERELGPEESVLVAKKNPFKYEEFKDARQEYSPELKDGDRFYEFDISRYDQNNITTLRKKLVGKTIRIGDTVVLVTDNSDYWWDNIIKLGIGKWTLKIDSNGNYELEPTNVHSSWRNIKENELVVMEFEKKIKPFIDFAQKSAKEVFNEVPLEQRDDNFFEIKRIQRTKTDF